jgi:hypothetical protein
MDIEGYLDSIKGSVWRADPHRSSSHDVEVTGRGTRRNGGEIVVMVREVRPGGFHKDPVQSIGVTDFIEHAVQLCPAGSDARKDYDRGVVPPVSPGMVTSR